MVFSFSGLNTYGKSGVGNVEGAFGSLNITRDPPRSYEVPHRVMVGDTSAITEEIAESQSRFIESIRKYPRGVNPAVDISYGNYAETGFQGAQAHPPYKIMNGGAFRPPVLSQQELLPLSRQVRGSTSASTNGQHIDYTLRPITQVNPQRAREINSNTSAAKRVSAPVYYALERPASAPDISASAVRSDSERILVGAGSGIRTIDLTKLIVRTPNGTTTENDGPGKITTMARYGSERLRRDELAADSVHGAGTIVASQSRGLPGSMRGSISSTMADTPHALADFGGHVRLSDILHPSASSSLGLGHVGSETVVRTPSKHLSERALYGSAPRASQASVGSETVFKTPTHSVLREGDIVHVNVGQSALGGQSHIGAATHVQYPSSGVVEDGEIAVARNVTSVIAGPLSSTSSSVVGSSYTAATRHTDDVLRFGGHTARGLSNGGAGLSSRVHLHSEPYVREDAFVLGRNVGTRVRGDRESNAGYNAYVGEVVRDDSLHASVSTTRTLEREHGTTAASRTIVLERNTPLVRTAPNRTSASFTTPFTSTEKRLRDLIAPGSFVPNEGAPGPLVVPDMALKRRGVGVSNYF